VRRRDFIAILVGSAVARPVAAVAGPAAEPVIGYLESQSPDPVLLAKFRQGLSEFGYFEDRNVHIEYRYAFGQYKQLSAMATDLVRQPVNLIVTAGGAGAANAAKRATSKIPILFLTGLDPIQEKLVASLGRPGGNATGVSHYNVPLISKRLELLGDLLQSKSDHTTASRIAFLMNPDDRGQAVQEPQINKIRNSGLDLGLSIYYASQESDLEPAFSAMAQEHMEALLIDSDPLFIRQRALIVSLAARYSLPVGYRDREFVEAGGLMSYGPSLPESWRQVGQYAGRILDGAKPEDLPVMMPRKYELVINRKTAKVLGLTLKRVLADEVID
jgi:putative tryptophan/tyrosine transport system substrate-binding protein